jgi:hypothetical protein
MFLIFGLLLVGTAVQLFRHRDQDPTVEDNALVTDVAFRAALAWQPRVTLLRAGRAVALSRAVVPSQISAVCAFSRRRPGGPRRRRS